MHNLDDFITDLYLKERSLKLSIAAMTTLILMVACTLSSRHRTRSSSRLLSTSTET